MKGINSSSLETGFSGLVLPASGSWLNTYDLTAYNDAGYDIIKSNTGDGLIICGETYNDQTYTGNAFVMKTDWNGNRFWNKNYYWGSLSSPGILFPCSGGGYLVGGSEGYYGWGFWMYPYLMKIDNEGIKGWDWNPSGTGEGRVTGISQLGDGSFIISYDSTNTTWSGSKLTRIGSTGTELWTRQYQNLTFNSLCKDSSGLFLYVGGQEFNSISGKNEALIASYWLDGSLRTKNTVPGLDYSKFFKVIQEPGGTLILSGDLNGNSWLYRTGHFSYIFPDNAMFSDIIYHNGYIYGAYYKGGGGPTYYIAKYSLQGTLIAEYPVTASYMPNINNLLGLDSGDLNFVGDIQTATGYNTNAVIIGLIPGIAPPSLSDRIGYFLNGYWYIDQDKSGTWTSGDVTSGPFGATGAMPLVINNHLTVFRDGYWYVDQNNNGRWDSADVVIGPFGAAPGTTPLIIGGHKSAFLNGYWYIDQDDSGSWTPGDVVCGPFGAAAGAIPLMINGHKSAFLNGYWYIDQDDSGTWTSGDVISGPFGTTAGSVPILIDDHLAVYYDLYWYVDYDNSGSWTSGDHSWGPFGGTSGSIPLVIHQVTGSTSIEQVQPAVSNPVIQTPSVTTPLSVPTVTIPQKRYMSPGLAGQASSPGQKNPLEVGVPGLAGGKAIPLAS
jgi:hypothetical protein